LNGQEGKYFDIGGATGIVDSSGTSEPVSAGAGAGVARGEGGDVVEMAGGVSEGGDSGGPDGGNAGDACSSSEGAKIGVANGDVDRKGGGEHEEGVVGETV
jgi:hypothetical protein